MAYKSKPRVSSPQADRELWINPRSNLRGPQGSRAWDNTGNISPTSGERFLELADVALGIKKPAHKKKKAAPAVDGIEQRKSNPRAG